MPKAEAKTISLKANVVGKPRMVAEYDENENTMCPQLVLTISAPLKDYLDWLLISRSAKEGLNVEITPLIQQLPMDDTDTWQLPN